MVLTSFLECPVCGVTIEGIWVTDAESLEDLASAPDAIQTCPDGHTWQAEWPGYSFFTEAGLHQKRKAT
jgi:hypothetical protein